ncbi:MAG TPA: glycosyltransferase family 87 protein [Pirellulales bacterium]|nr:glycosyltransferase family 87 protein [Pirellulales bacterium]
MFMIAACAAAIFAGLEFYRCVFRYDNDFLWHRNLGLDFLNDRVYETFAFHYPPARAMIDAVTAWLPYRVDRALWLVATCAGLAWCVRFWSTIGAAPGRRWGLPAGIAVAVMGCYIVRDLPECGLQLFLLCMLSVGLWALLRGRPALCGWSLGLAAVYKVTPVIFLPYLLWKRQWRAAGWMAAASACFCALPAVYLGWQKDVTLHRQWLSFVGYTLSLEDPSENGVEKPVLRNQSFPLMLARLVQKYPADHPLYVKSDAFVCLARLEPPQAKNFVRAVLACMAIALAWRFRQRCDLSDGGISLAGEWSAVCILIAIMSPLCWLQHLVLAIPAALLFAQAAAARTVMRWQVIVAGMATGLALLVHRDLIGVTLCDMLSCYQPHTVAALLIMLLVLTLGPCRAVQEGELPAEIINLPFGLASTGRQVPLPHPGQVEERPDAAAVRWRRAA